MGDKLQLALVGHGYLGSLHFTKLKQLNAYADCYAVVETDERKKLIIQKNFPGIKVVSDIGEVLDNIDGALVVSPTSTHYEIVKILLEHDKHVFCEKPLTATLQQALLLQDLHSFQKSILQVGHSERYHQIWELIASYRSFFTPPCSVRINRYAPFKKRAVDVDVIFDLMIHDLDLLKFLFKREPKILRSKGYKIRTNKWDHVSSELSLGDDIYVHITVSRNHVKEERNWEITSSSGCFYIDLLDCKYYISHNNDEKVHHYSYEKRDHLLMEQEDFCRAIRHEKKPMVDVSEGVCAMKMAFQVLRGLDAVSRKPDLAGGISP
ncbi:MAG: Gfo/Idh/MocA family oxidoreductase [Halobacteriovoraceae bacterium]|nr:Gfo/Idh/MocA family oxidoreductase [Halobacteriovoraceae bacterium]